MARISLLFSLALLLAIASVSAHPKKTQKSLCPSTLSGLQTFTSAEISKLIEKKAQFAPKNNQVNALFSISKSYNDYLLALKFSASRDVIASDYTKYSLMNKALSSAKSAVVVDGKMSVEVKKSYSKMARGFVQLVKNIGVVSKKYKFDGEAKISKIDGAKVEKCLIKLEGSISVFLKVVSKCSKNVSATKKVDFSVLPGKGLVGNLVGQSRHALAKGEAKIGAHGKGKLEAHTVAKLGTLVGGKTGAKAGGMFGRFFGFGRKAYFDAAGKAKSAHTVAKLGTLVGAKGGAQAGGAFGRFFGFGRKAYFDAAGKAKSGAHTVAKLGTLVGGKGGAQTEANAEGAFARFFWFGKKANFDAAGKAKFGGGNVFRSIPRSKHLN